MASKGNSLLVVGDEHKLNNEARYLAVWSEINSKIEVRANMNIAHFTLILTLAGLIYSSIDRPDPTLQGFLFNKHTFSEKLFYLSCFMPMVSTVFVLWYLQHDRGIGIMSGLLREIEDQHQKSDSGWFLPAMQSDRQGWMTLLLEYRTFGDVAMSIICLISLINPLLMLFGRIDFISAAPTGSFFVECFAVLFGVSLTWFNINSLLSNKFRRDEAMRASFDRQTGQVSNTRRETQTGPDGSKKEVTAIIKQDSTVQLVRSVIPVLRFILYAAFGALPFIMLVAFYFWAKT